MNVSEGGSHHVRQIATTGSVVRSDMQPPDQRARFRHSTSSSASRHYDPRLSRSMTWAESGASVSGDDAACTSDPRAPVLDAARSRNGGGPWTRTGTNT